MEERSHLAIGEVLSLLRDEFPDVTISKIRFLESQGLVNPERTPSGYRKFYDADVERLRWILLQQKEHFLPLKVIKDRLAELTPAVEAEPQGVGVDRAGVGTALPGGAGVPEDQGAVLTAAVEAAGSPAPEMVVTEVLAAQGGGEADGLAGDLASSSPGAPTDLEPGDLSPNDLSPDPGLADDVLERAASGAASSNLAAGTGSGPEPPEADGVEVVALELVTEPAEPAEAAESVEAVVLAEAVELAEALELTEVVELVEVAEALQPAEASEPAEAVERAGAPNSVEGLAGERNESPPATGTNEAAPPRAGGPRSTSTGQSETLTLDELAAAAGIDRAALAELQSFGLVTPSGVVGGTTYFDQIALEVARTAGAFARHGVEARHLRAWRNGAEREASLFEQVVMPVLRQRNPQARHQAEATLAELAGLGADLREALVRQALRSIR